MEENQSERGGQPNRRLYILQVPPSHLGDLAIRADCQLPVSCFALVGENFKHGWARKSENLPTGPKEREMLPLRSHRRWNCVGAKGTGSNHHVFHGRPWEGSVLNTIL